MSSLGCSFDPGLSWHARVVSSLKLMPGYALPRVAQCDAAVITARHDPWAGLYKRPVGMPAVRTLTSPYNVGFTVARNMSLACLGLVHKHIVLLTEAEERAIETNAPEPEHVPFPWEELPVVLKRGAVNSCMDMTVLSTRGIIDWMAGDLLVPNRCSVETVVRMHTDMRRTSRALAPAYPMGQRFTRVVKTAVWSEITLYTSEWLVTSVLDTVRLVMEGKDRFVERLVLKMAVNGARCATLWLAVSVGNGVGASSPRMRPLMMLVGANAAALVVNMYWRRASVRIEARAFGEGDAGDGKSGDVGDVEGTHDGCGGSADGSCEEEGEQQEAGSDNDAVDFAAQPSISPTGIPWREPREDMTDDTEGSKNRKPRQPPSGIPSLPVRKRKSPPSGLAGAGGRSSAS